jgi:hypothetical protein
MSANDPDGSGPLDFVLLARPWPGYLAGCCANFGIDKIDFFARFDAEYRLVPFRTQQLRRFIE